MSDHKPQLDKVKESVMAAMAKNSAEGDDEILLLVKEALNEESSAEAAEDDDDLAVAVAARAVGAISGDDISQIEERVRELVVSLVKEFTEDELPHLVEDFVRRRLKEVL